MNNPEKDLLVGDTLPNAEKDFEREEVEDIVMSAALAKQMDISVRVYSVAQIMADINDGYLRAAEMQRRSDLWDAKTQSRLIESLLIGIPIPLFYISTDKDNVWSIVDGLQRTSALKNYLLPDKDGKFKKFVGLEYLGAELDGKTYDDLDPTYRRKIQQTQLQFAVIQSTTPDAIKRNIFKRLNTGGLALNAQEIRFALHYGDGSCKVLNGCTNSTALKLAINGGDTELDNSRMLYDELALRYMAFRLSPLESIKSMDDLLDETMKMLNKLSPEAIEEYVQQFELAMERAHLLFGEHAFRRSYLAGKRSPINKAMFETISVELSRLEQSQFDLLLTHNIDFLCYYYAALFTSSSPLAEQLFGRYRDKSATIIERFNTIRSLLHDYKPTT